MYSPRLPAERRLGVQNKQTRSGLLPLPLPTLPPNQTLSVPPQGPNRPEPMPLGTLLEIPASALLRTYEDSDLIPLSSEHEMERLSLLVQELLEEILTLTEEIRILLEP